MYATVQKQQLREDVSLFRQYAPDRPLPDRNLDQFLATEETVLKRAEILGGIKNIAEKKLLFLGDDDLTLIIFSWHYRAAKITVVDVDKRLLRFLDDVSKKENLPINFSEHDLRMPLLKKEFRDYDIVFLTRHIRHKQLIFGWRGQWKQR